MHVNFIQVGANVHCCHRDSQRGQELTVPSSGGRLVGECSVFGYWFGFLSLRAPGVALTVQR